MKITKTILFAFLCSCIFTGNMQAQYPQLVGHWTFESGCELIDLTGNFNDLVLHGATVNNGSLDVDFDMWATSIGYSGPAILDKTLVSWVRLDALTIPGSEPFSGGSILTIDKTDLDEFDAIVFGERQPARWMAGSAFYFRTEDPVPGYEENSTGELIQMAICYKALADNKAQIKIFHNGDLIGSYEYGESDEFGDMITFEGGNTEILFGLRHTMPDGSYPWIQPWLNAKIEEARIYNGCLTQTQVQELTLCHYPSISSVTGPDAPVELGVSLALDISYSDADATNINVNWNDGSDDDYVPLTGMVHAEHAYAESGVYPVLITLTNSCGLTDTYSYDYVVIYDPSGGFVSGAGLIDSPAGAYTGDETLEGKANFGFVSKYKKGTTVPIGNTEFQFKAGDLKFNSTQYEWLVIAGSKAMFKGSGTINGTGNYKFLISAIDGDLKDKGDDRFRIKIWEELVEDFENVIYDNQIGDPEDADPSTPIVAGSIVIHTKDVLKSAELIDPVAKFNIYPNPFDHSVSIDLFGRTSHEIIIHLIDLNGQIVDNLYSGVISAEVDHHFEFNMKADLTPGSYILRITTEEGELLGREIIIKR